MNETPPHCGITLSAFRFKSFHPCQFAICLIVAIFAPACIATAAIADELPIPVFSFNGYGTLGVVHSSERRADFTSSIFKPNGAGFSRQSNADVDTLIAGQITANWTPRLSAVVQVISEQNYDNTYRPHVEWANIKFLVTPDFGVRVGRVMLLTFNIRS